MGRCLIFAKNTDDNCLYASLILAIADKQMKIVIDGVTHTFTKDDFKRRLMDYSTNCRVLNLY